MFTFYGTVHGDYMMGVDLFDALEGSVVLCQPPSPIHIASDCRSSSKLPVIAVSQELSSSVSQTHYSVLLKSSGQLRGLVHEPHVDMSVKPGQHIFWHLPLATREPIERELDRMLKTGVIEKVESSPWISNIVTARKKDGTVRLCINMTSANQALVRERQPLPTMEEPTAMVTGCSVFSKLDLLKVYFRLELNTDVRYLTAFVLHVGLFQFKTVVFGMSTGPSAFQSVIHKILEVCTNTLDDFLEFGRGMANHEVRLHDVLQLLMQFNATVRVDECVIGKPGVEFNGHRVSAAGVRPLRSNVEAIMEMPVPSAQRGLTRLLCTTAY